MLHMATQMQVLEQHLQMATFWKMDVTQCSQGSHLGTHLGTHLGIHLGLTSVSPTLTGHLLGACRAAGTNGSSLAGMHLHVGHPTVTQNIKKTIKKIKK